MKSRYISCSLIVMFILFCYISVSTTVLFLSFYINLLPEAVFRTRLGFVSERSNDFTYVVN